jgi:hypothetical protein
MTNKKTYTPPKLVVYGDIRQVTRSAAKNQNKDGGSNALKT